MLDIVLFRCYTNPIGDVCVRRPYSLSIRGVDEEDTPEAQVTELAGYKTWRQNNSPGSVVLRKFAAELSLARAIEAVDHDSHSALGRFSSFQVLL